MSASSRLVLPARLAPPLLRRAPCAEGWPGLRCVSEKGEERFIYFDFKGFFYDDFEIIWAIFIKNIGKVEGHRR